MPRFKIPIKYKEGWSSFVQLSKEKKLEFSDLIENAPVGLFVKELANFISAKIEMKPDSVIQITESLYSIFDLKAQTNLDVRSFVKEIIEALRVAKIEPLDDIEPYLVKLLSINGSINLTLKASVLATDRQNILNTTRIVTDIRPLFGLAEESDVLKGSMIAHNIKIEYQEDGQTKFIYFALDSNDLKELKANIERAQRKEENIKNSFGSMSKFIELK